MIFQPEHCLEDIEPIGILYGRWKQWGTINVAFENLTVRGVANQITGESQLVPANQQYQPVPTQEL
jgi:hypothetical protein